MIKNYEGESLYWRNGWQFVLSNSYCPKPLMFLNDSSKNGWRFSSFSELSCSLCMVCFQKWHTLFRGQRYSFWPFLWPKGQWASLLLDPAWLTSTFFKCRILWLWALEWAGLLPLLLLLAQHAVHHRRLLGQGSGCQQMVPAGLWSRCSPLDRRHRQWRWSRSQWIAHFWCVRSQVKMLSQKTTPKFVI